MVMSPTYGKCNCCFFDSFRFYERGLCMDCELGKERGWRRVGRGDLVEGELGI